MKRFVIDPNIPETGEQLVKSNNGPDTCCYEYCDSFSVYKGVCAYCDSIEIDSKDITITQESQHKQNSNVEKPITQQRYDNFAIAQLDTPPQTCQLVI